MARGRLIPAPNVDDRDWIAIVDAMRAYAAAHLGEWTDLNASDPGVTLMEAVAQQVETVIVRLNAILRKHLIEYLNMIGVTLTPPAASRVHCFFRLRTPPTTLVVIPKGFEVGTAAVGDDKPVVFTLDQNLTITKTELKRCYSKQGSTWTDHTADANNPATTFAPLPSVQAGDELYFAHDTDCYWDRMSVDLDVAASGVTGVWEYWEELPDGSSGWETLVVTDGSSGFTADGDLEWSVTAHWSPSEVNGFTGTWIRFRVTAVGGGATFATLRYFALKSILGRGAVSNAVTIDDEVLGSSDGGEDQAFFATKVPILDQTLIVDEGEGFVAWKEREDLTTSASAERHYQKNDGTGEFLFGDGRHGKIPAVGSGNIKLLPYRWGGGKRGNVGATTIAVLRQSHPHVASVTNLADAAGGADEETVDEAIERGPTEALKTRDRGVTDEDFETLVLQGAPGISRVKTFPLHDPSNPGVETPGVLSVVVLPEGGVALSASLRQAIINYLDARRLLTAELYVVEVEFVDFNVSVAVKRTAEANAVELQALIEDVLREYYDPEHGGDPARAVNYAQDAEEERGTGWEFGRDVYRSELFEILERVPGLDHVQTITTPAATVTVEDYQLPRLQTVTITVVS